MSQNGEARYSFPAGIPIEPVDPGSTVLVAGPALTQAEDLVQSLVAHGTDTGEGALFISTNMTCERLLKACGERQSSFDLSRVGVVDCSGHEVGQPRPDVRVKYVSTQSDLTGIGMNFSSLYESLYADATDGRLRTGLISLSSLSMFVDLRKLFKFTQTLSGRIESAGGLGVYAIDPTTHDTKTVNTLSQTVDGRIEVRDPEDADDDADGHLRVRGLSNQPSGWQPFSLS
jgi:hypothetical protein